MPVGIVTGLSAEARIARRALHRDDRVACAAASPQRARTEAERLIGSGADALLSFGVAGGLDPALKPGTLILAETVVEGDETYPSDADWHDAVMAEAAPLALVPGALAGSDHALTSAADKSALYEASDALAVDMESHAVAAVAAERGLPFLALRAIADPAQRSLPRAALGSIGPDGRSRLGPVLLGLGRRPWELPALLALDRSFRAALAALEKAAKTLERPLFGGL